VAINTEQMFKQLQEIQTDIELKKESINDKLEHRKNVVRFCYAEGMSAIKIGQALNCTRQRVYVLIEEAIKDEEE
jgi:DNA-directed RNA polymerase specialized sigma subunit